jgi:DNA-directed RNA polymerase specialized sigma24 family protein
MDHDALVRRASDGDVRAFVELTQRFQHFAFGSALTLLQDFQRAEDVVQEAFVAAWSRCRPWTIQLHFLVGCEPSCGTTPSVCCVESS